MNETHSMARITAQRASYDYRDYHRSRLSLMPRQCARVVVLCCWLSLLVLWWLAQVI